MTDQSLEVFDDGGFNNEGPRKRPAFILVLAILSWVFVAYGVVIRVTGSTVSENKHETDMEVLYEEVDKLGEAPIANDMIVFAEAAYENRKVSNLGQLIFLLLEGIAVFMMFNLKRSGFWLYTIAQIGFLFIVFYVLPGENILSKMAIGYYVFIAILFEILYAVNLKYMKG